MILGASYDFKFHSERWVVINTGPTMGSYTLYFTIRNIGDKNKRTNMGTDFLFTPSCGYPSKWNKIHDNGRDRKPVLVMKGLVDGKKEHFPWFGQFLTIMNSPLHAILRDDNKLAYRMCHWNRLLGWDLKGVSWTGWMICRWLFLYSESVLGTPPPPLGMLEPAGPIYQHKWSPEKLGHI